MLTAIECRLFRILPQSAYPRRWTGPRRCGRSPSSAYSAGIGRYRRRWSGAAHRSEAFYETADLCVPAVADKLIREVGYVNIDGPSLAYNIYNQVNKLEIDYLFDELVSIDYDNKIVNTDSDKISYKYLIIATGRSPKELDILTEYKNNGVSYCALCDGPFYKDKEVAVIGAGDSALLEALFLSNICSRVTIINKYDNMNMQRKLA